MTKTQSDRMFESLRDDILSCRLLPDSKLLIKDIAEASEVSLGAVREALSRLGAEGLVVANPQKGYRVSPVSIEDLRDVTEARVEIEQILLSRSIAHGDLEWETNLVAAWHRLSKTSEHMPENPNGLEQWAAAHAGFHRALVVACGSSKLLQIRAQLYQQSQRYRNYSGVVARERDVFAEHQRIFNATIARDAAAATDALANHFRVTADVIINALRKDDALFEGMGREDRDLLARNGRPTATGNR